MEKVVRNGKTAVLISPGYGAGWYTWNKKKELLFHPLLVQAVEENRKDDIEKILEKIFPGEEFFLGGLKNLTVEWVEEGTKFLVREYDGHESIELEKEVDWITA